MRRETTGAPRSAASINETHEKIARAALGIGWALITVGVGAAAGLARKAAEQLDQGQLAEVIDLDSRRPAKDSAAAESPDDDAG